MGLPLDYNCQTLAVNHQQTMQFGLKSFGTLFGILSATLGILLAVLYISACLFLLLRQNRLMFFPDRKISTLPTDLEMAYQEVWLPVNYAQTEPETATENTENTENTEKIHGWWIPATADFPAAKDGWVLLYLHGNADNMSENLNHSKRFHLMGFSVFIMDYRGYGISQGDFPTESTVYEDAETAWNYLVKQRGISPKKIVIYGHSLGGAIAIELADRHPNAAGAIIECSFTSMRDMVDYQYPYFNVFPIDWILTHRFDSIAKVKSLKMPVLFTHGTADDVVPIDMSQALFAATPEPKQLFIVPNADHNNIASVSGDKYFETIRKFMKLIDR